MCLDKDVVTSASIKSQDIQSDNTIFHPTLIHHKAIP
jgi:hypothetical protein